MKFAHAPALVAVLGAEALLFLAAAHHHYAWSYPRWSDQAQYLGQAYDGYDLARHTGYAAAAWSMLTAVSAQGCLHGILALPVFAAVGASRTAALALNILAFVAWQLGTFLAVRRLSGSTSMAWASIGFLASLHFPWSGGAGSAVDFRLDWMAACAYGVTLEVALAARGFRSTRWAVLFGAVVGATILLRFLTAAYFGLIFFALLAWTLTQADRWARSARLTLSGLIAAGIFLPVFWRNRSTIYTYYWIGHFTGPERALRESHMGAIESVRWILYQVGFGEVGVAALILGAAALIGLYLLGRFPGLREPATKEPGSLRDSWVAVAIFFAAPAVILAMHSIKEQPPASILIPGVVWFILLLWTGRARRTNPVAVTVVGSAVLVIGLLTYVGAQLNGPFLESAGADFRAINGLGDYLYFRSEEAGLDRPRVAFNRFLEGIRADSLGVLGFERHKRRVHFVTMLPTGLFAVPRQEVMRVLAESDFVCLATRASVDWPFDREMAELLPEMRAWCEGNLKYAGSLETAAFSISVYERRDLGPRPGFAGVELSRMVSDASRGAPYDEAMTPAAPFFVFPAHAFASTTADFHYRLFAAYSPVLYKAVRLPDGLALDSDTGEIHGRFLRPGIFEAEVSASNRSGTTSSTLEVRVEDSAWFSFLEAPGACSAGLPFAIGFDAFDSDGTLAFIDVTDLTTGKTLHRLVPSDSQRQSWAGTDQVTLVESGLHTVLMRFVRYDKGAKEPYTFIDRQCEVRVSP